MTSTESQDDRIIGILSGAAITPQNPDVELAALLTRLGQGAQTLDSALNQVVRDAHQG